MSNNAIYRLKNGMKKMCGRSRGEGEKKNTSFEWWRHSRQSSRRREQSLGSRQRDMHSLKSIQKSQHRPLFPVIPHPDAIPLLLILRLPGWPICSDFSVFPLHRLPSNAKLPNCHCLQIFNFVLCVVQAQWRIHVPTWMTGWGCQ